MTKYPIPARTTRVETVVVNSRFIATIGRADTVAEARQFIQAARDEMPDATHHVYAFRVGYGGSVTEGMSDDGEPSGTSGPPVLAVLRGADLGDVVIVVTRYFGGTLLGTGGLVKAYGDAVRAVLKLARRAVKVPTTTLGVQLPYPLFEQVQRLAAARGAEVLESQFLTDVTLMLRFRDEELDAFYEQLAHLSAGQVTPVVLERNPETIFPLD